MENVSSRRVSIGGDKETESLMRCSVMIFNEGDSCDSCDSSPPGRPPCPRRRLTVG